MNNNSTPGNNHIMACNVQITTNTRVGVDDINQTTQVDTSAKKPEFLLIVIVDIMFPHKQKLQKGIHSYRCRGRSNY